MERALLVALGGALGTLGRYLTALAAVHLLGHEFPWGTLVVNLVGAFLIGLVQSLGLEAIAISEDMRLFLATGIMGGLTTYSAFSYETVALAEGGAWPRALLYVGVTTVACLGLCYLGMAPGRMLVAVRG